MRRRLISTIFGLEVYAVALASVQAFAGLHTDEAKYLLNIPYPHPPFFRFLLSLTIGMPFAELLWRLVIASAVVQCVWIVWDMAAVLQRERKLALAAAWLLAAPVVLQAGTIMTVVPVTLFGLLFVWCALNQRDCTASHAPLVGFLWLVALFTAFQSLLFVPVVFSILLKMRCSKKQMMLYAGVPFLLLALYALMNPFVFASMFSVAVQDSVLSFGERISGVARVWVLSGGLLTIVGLWGVFASGRRDLQLSAFLILAYIALSAQPYYALLLVPLLVAGVYSLFCFRKLSAKLFFVGHLCSTVLLLSFLPPDFTSAHADQTLSFLRTQGVENFILIDGPFGHEWQYASPVPIRRFSQNLAMSVENEAGAFICTKVSCAEDINKDVWVRLDGAPAQVWVRR